jgi:hypothetical protein
MSKPGPKPGWKKAAAAQAAAPAAATQAPVQQPLPPVLAVVAPIVAPAAPAAAVLSAADRENPDKLTGEALHALAHRRGLARSAIERLSDEKIRTELRYLTYRQYEAA